MNRTYRDQNPIPDFQQYYREWAQDLELLRQNSLLSERAFIRFAQDRGIAVHGVVTGDPGDFHKRGWLHMRASLRIDQMMEVSDLSGARLELLCGVELLTDLPGVGQAPVRREIKNAGLESRRCKG